MNTRKWHKFMDILIILTLTVSVGIFILMPFFYILKEAFEKYMGWEVYHHE